MMSKESKYIGDTDSEKYSDNFRISHSRKLSQPADSELKVEDL